MRKSILKLEAIPEADNCFRTIFKNNHGREIYMSIRLENGSCIITGCFTPTETGTKQVKAVTVHNLKSW